MACDRNDGGEGAFEERIAVLVSDIFVRRVDVVCCNLNEDLEWEVRYQIERLHMLCLFNAF